MRPLHLRKHCVFERHGKSAVCNVCGRVVENAPDGKLVAFCREQLGGPGTSLKSLLAKFGITATQTCKCNAMAKRMDEWGPEHTLEHIEDVVDVMQEAANARGLPFSRIAGRMLVRWAVRNAKRAAAG